MRLYRKFIIILAMLLVAVVLGGCSLAEDITPPPNYRPPTVAPQQPVSASTLYPLVPPDPAQGAVIFAEKCQPCHGAKGMGDGPQAANLSNTPAAIGSPELARKSRPVDWFQTVTVGNFEKFMPGFSQGLTDRQRWDVISYVYTLSSTEQELAQGKANYEANCATCHGDSGRGDGPHAASLTTKPASWADQSRMTRLSAADVVTVMTGGKQGHASFADKITDEEQRYGLAAYIRSMSFAQAGKAEEAKAQTAPTTEATPANGATATSDGAATPVSATPAGTAAADSPTGNLTINGTVTNGTPGGKLPESGMEAHLRVFDGMNPAFDKTAEVGKDASFKFENVGLNTNYVYLVQVTYNGLSFNSDILHGSDIAGNQMDMPVKVYEVSSDISVLKADRMHVFFDFSQPGKVQVVNLYVVSNPTDKVIVGKTADDPVITFDLPKGYENLQFQDGELGARYVKTDNGFGDRMGIYPGAGQQQILFGYDLPYDKKLGLDIKVPIPVDAATVMMPPGGVKLKADQLVDAGQRDVQGTSFKMYTTSSTIEAGKTLKLELSGAPGATSATNTNSTTYLLIGAGAFGLVLIGAGLWFFRQRSDVTEQEAIAVGADGAEPQESSEALLDAIVALDDLHANGKLPEAAYQERRTDLKSRLADAITREKSEQKDEKTTE